jgi:5-methyltetrahydrofolate--homocysteine methyltransferase
VDKREKERLMIDSERFTQALLNGNIEEVIALTKSSLSQGEAAQTILQEGLIAGMDVVGKKFRSGQLYIPEVLMAARVMQAGMDLLKPALTTSGLTSGPRFLLGTVKGDLHDIGKNLVGMLLKGAGFEVADIGVDTSPESFEEAIKRHRPKVVGLSALLTTTMAQMKTTLDSLEQAGVMGGVKSIVGGAPVTQAFADKIGANGYAPDASSAVEKVKELLADMD